MKSWSSALVTASPCLPLMNPIAIPAKSRYRARVEEDLVEHLGREDPVGRGAGRDFVPGGRGLQGHRRFLRLGALMGRPVAVTRVGLDQAPRLGVVSRLVRAVAQRVHPPAALEGDEVQGDQAAGDLHHRQHHRHVRGVRDVGRGQDAEAGHEGARRVGPVIARHRRRVDPSQPGERPEEDVGQDADHEVRDEADDHEPAGLAQLRGRQVGELLAAVPADRDQQVDHQTLVDDVREVELDPQDRDQETHVEEEQQRLEEVVREIVPELLQHRGKSFRKVSGSRPRIETSRNAPANGRDRRRAGDCRRRTVEFRLKPTRAGPRS